MTPEEQVQARERQYNATVAWLKRAHDDLMIVRVRPDYKLPAHKPGQYTTLGLGAWEPRHPGCQPDEVKPGEEARLIRRAYSISSSILDETDHLLNRDGVDWLEFYIVLVREAPKAPGLTPRLFLLNEGSRVFLGEKITGHFTLDPVKPGDTVLFLSTGTGEAPHNYMSWELLRRKHEGRILNACCVRYRRDLGYLDIQEKLMAQFPNYIYLSLTTREAASAGNKVYIQDLLTSGQLEQKLGEKLDPARTHVYLCGNPAMIGVPTTDKASGTSIYPQPPGIIEILEKRGFSRDLGGKVKGNIHFEEYW